MGHSVFLLCASLAPYTKLVYSRGQHLQIEFCQLGPLCIKKGLGEVTELSKRADGKSHCKGGISIFWVLPWCFFVWFVFFCFFCHHQRDCSDRFCPFLEGGSVIRWLSQMRSSLLAAVSDTGRRGDHQSTAQGQPFSRHSRELVIMEAAWSLLAGWRLCGSASGPLGSLWAQLFSVPRTGTQNTELHIPNAVVRD